MKETQIVKDCLELLFYKRFFAWRNNTVGIFDSTKKIYRFHGLKGVADILSCYKGRFIAIECKSKGEKQSNEQKEFQKNLEQAGGIYFLVYSRDELEKMILTI